MPFEAYFAGRGASSYAVSFTIPSEMCDKEVYYVVERVGVRLPENPILL